MWHDGAMAKRSTRIAKRDEFEKALKEVEAKIRSRRERNPPGVGVGVEATGQREERGGESTEVEVDPQGRRK